MTVIIVDDERLTLKMMTQTVKEVFPDAEVQSYMRASDALAFAESHPIAIAFLDIQMRGISGTELAQKLQVIQPRINIIFCTAFDEYKSSAMDLRASGYLVKPVTSEDIQRELPLLRFPLEIEEPKAADQLVIRCFGDFQATYQGEPIQFSYQKTNELLAVLVDRNGAICSYGMIESMLWEDDNGHTAYLKRIRQDLLATMEGLGLSDVIVTQRGMLGLRVAAVKCDYFDFLAGDKQAIAAYQGEYMSQYSWSEETNSSLWWRKDEMTE